MKRRRTEYRAYIPVRISREYDESYVSPYFVYKDDTPPHKSLPIESSRLIASSMGGIIRRAGEYLENTEHPINEMEPLNLLVIEKLVNRKRGQYAVKDIVQLEIIEEQSDFEDLSVASRVI